MKGWEKQWERRKENLREYIEHVKQRGQYHPWELSELEWQLKRM